MADTETQKAEVVPHENIFEALAAFQAENPEIKRTKTVSFGEGNKKVEFTYAPLDEVLQTVRPLTAKHGLSFMWTKGEKEGEMVCVLYHSSFTGKGEEHETVTERSEVPQESAGDDRSRVSTHREIRRPVAQGVLYSMAVKVKRDGDMKGIGSDSTYARRYTLAEVLGIAPDEDDDVAAEQERLGRVEGFAFKQAMTRVQNASDKALTEQMKFFEEELKLLAGEKPTKLGFKKEQYDELVVAGAKRRSQLTKEPNIPPGENAVGADN